MTEPEFNEVVDWIEARWPDQWRQEQIVAYYEDLQAFDASDVWSAVYRWSNEGNDFAPKGSRLVVWSNEERRQTALDSRYDNPALPEPAKLQVREGSIADLYPGEVVSGYEHIRRVHTKHGPCGSRYCDIHAEEKETV